MNVTRVSRNSRAGGQSNSVTCNGGGRAVPSGLHALSSPDPSCCCYAIMAGEQQGRLRMRSCETDEGWSSTCQAGERELLGGWDEARQ